MKPNRRLQSFSLCCIGAFALCILLRCALDGWALASGQALALWGIADDAFGNGQAAFGAVGVVAWRLLCLVATSTVTAIVEEALFRGVFFRGLARWIRPKTHNGIFAAAMVSSALFGLAHGADPALALSPSVPAFAVAALKALQAFAFGLVMAELCQKTGGLLVPVVAHGLFDLGYFAVPVLAVGAFPESYVAVGPANVALLCATAVLLAIPAAVGSKWITHSREEVPPAATARV